MKTKTFTVDNILVLMTWGSDKKIYVKYFQNNEEIKEWFLLDEWQRNAIANYYSSYYMRNSLILWNY